MKRGPDTRSPPALTPPPSKRKCLQTTPPPLATNGTSCELDLSSLHTNGVRRGGRSSQSSVGSNTSTPPGSPGPTRRGRGRSATPAEPESPTPTRRSTRLRHRVFSFARTSRKIFLKPPCVSVCFCMCQCVLSVIYIQSFYLSFLIFKFCWSISLFFCSVLTRKAKD